MKKLENILLYTSIPQNENFSRSRKGAYLVFPMRVYL